MKKEDFIISEEINAGEDFYGRCCKEWMKNNPIPEDKSRLGTFDVLAEENRKYVMEEIIPNSINTSITNLYKKYISDNSNSEKIVLADIQEYESQLFCGGETFWTAINDLRSKGIPGLFNIYFDYDPDDSRKYIISIGEPAYSLPTKDYYTDPKYSDTKNAYIKLMKDLFKRFDKEHYNVEEYVFKTEADIASHCYLPEEGRDVFKTTNKMMFCDLKKRYENINWEIILNRIFFNKLRDDDYVNVINPGALEYIDSVINNKIAISCYYVWRIIRTGSKYCGDDLYNLNFNFFGKLLNGQEKPESKEKRAASLVTSYYGELIGAQYVSKKFDVESKTKMDELIKGLRDSFRERIEAQTWLSDETKEKALLKLSQINWKIGYPDNPKKYSWLGYIDSTTDSNLWSIIKYLNSREDYHEITTKFGKPVDRDEWFMYAQSVNAYYNPPTNEICFPAGILQFPFFSKDASDSWNYGAIGAVIGHEMTHGFDDQGRNFDGKGNLSNWWTDSDKKKFDEIENVIKEYFNKIEVLPGKFANGQLTLGENTADHGGLMIALNALKKLPNYNLKEFFQAYASVWASNSKDELKEIRTDTDPHSLPEWRVNGSLPHIDDWYEAFDIKESDKLFVSPEERFRIW